MLFILTRLPSFFTTMASGRVLGFQTCVAVGFVTISFTLQRMYLMFVFVIDRFLSVFYPFFYEKYRIKITISLSAVSLVSVPAICLPSIPTSLDCFGFTTLRNSCTSLHSCSPSCSTIQTVVPHSRSPACNSCPSVHVHGSLLQGQVSS